MKKISLIFLFCFCELVFARVYVPKKHPHNRIIGGIPANIIDFPYQVSIQHDGNHDCGGSIINENYILTAAHCTDVESAIETIVVAGSSYLNETETVSIPVEEIFTHPDFRYISYDYDIAILKLKTPLKYSTSIQPVSLPEKNTFPKAKQLANLTGWGATQEGTMKMSDILLVTEVPIVSRDECVKDYPLDGINERDICAGFKDGGHDTCLGDSGGPLVIDGVLIGVASWGYGCGEPNRPGVYMNVAAFRDFIYSKAGI